MSDWTKQTDKIKGEPKFVAKGTTVTVDFDVGLVMKPDVPGKWGPRKMWIVNTEEFGKVYVNELQLCHIAKLAKGEFKGKMSVVL